MRKVMLGNVKIKEIMNFKKLRNSENILFYQKPLLFLNEMNRLWKNIFLKIIYFGYHGA